MSSDPPLLLATEPIALALVMFLGPRGDMRVPWSRLPLCGLGLWGLWGVVLAPRPAAAAPSAMPAPSHVPPVTWKLGDTMDAAGGCTKAAVLSDLVEALMCGCPCSVSDLGRALLNS